MLYCYPHFNLGTRTGNSNGIKKNLALNFVHSGGVNGSSCSSRQSESNENIAAHDSSSRAPFEIPTNPCSSVVATNTTTIQTNQSPAETSQTINPIHSKEQTNQAIEQRTHSAIQDNLASVITNQSTTNQTTLRKNQNHLILENPSNMQNNSQQQKAKQNSISSNDTVSKLAPPRLAPNPIPQFYSQVSSADFYQIQQGTQTPPTNSINSHCFNNSSNQLSNFDNNQPSLQTPREPERNEYF